MTAGMSIRSLSLMKLRRMMARIGTASAVPGSAVDAGEFDWTVPHHFQADQAEQVRLLGRRIAAAFETVFQELASQPVEIGFLDLREQFADQMVRQLTGEPPLPYLLALEDSTGQPVGLIVIDFESAVSMVARMLHDPEAAVGQDGRFSSLEESILSDIFGFLAEGLVQILKDFAQLEIHPEEKPEQEKWKLPARELEDLCQLRLELKCGQESSPFSIIFESRVLDAYTGAASAVSESREKTAQKILSRIRLAPVTAEACLHSGTIGMNEMMQLAPGDILLLGKKIGTPVRLKVNGRPCYQAYPAAQNGNLALVIAEFREDLD